MTTKQQKARERVQEVLDNMTDASDWVDENYNTIQTALQHLLESLPVEEGLASCPFCGGEAEITEKHTSPTMNGKSILISAEVRHFCPRVEGQPHGMSVKQIGRDRESAIKAWNNRTQTPALQAYINEMGE